MAAVVIRSWRKAAAVATEKADFIAQHYELVSPEKLCLHPRNARKGNLRAISESISENGWYGAVVAQRSTGRILAGNHRYLAAVDKGLEVVPVIWLDVDDDRALRILLADNRTNDLAFYDDGALAALLGELSADGGLLGTGYDQASLDALLASLRPVIEDPGPRLDEAEALRVQWGTERGQIWEIGRHRLMCGDATSAEDVGRLLEGAKPNLMVTDPPYGVDYDPNWRKVAAEKGQLAYAPRRVRTVANDERSDWTEAWRLFPGDVAYTWSPPGASFNEHCAALKRAGFEQRNSIMWAKPHFPFSRGHYTVRHEPCIYAVRKGARAHWIGPKNESTVWDIALDRNIAGGHSTQKPLECMARPIRNHSGDVYDPFLGSGTTLVAAEQLGRRCWAMDIDPGYCAVTLQRLTDIGLEPKRVYA